MKITDKRTESKPATFYTLPCGEVFEYMNAIYLKLNSPGLLNNTYNFTKGMLVTFSDEIINPLEAELVIRGEKHD